MRILIGECKQEVSTFNPAESAFSDFVIQTGQEILDFHAGLASEVGGAMSVFAASDCELIGAYSARSITSGGTLSATGWNRIKRDFLDVIRATPRVDAIYLALHGAMCAANDVDPEGSLLAEVRSIVGDVMPIVVSLDLHGIVTNRMLEAVDAAVAYHTYPHNDFFTTGVRAGELLVRIVSQEVRPVTAICRVPALVRGDELITATGRIGARVREAQAVEAAPGGLSAAMFWGNPFTDVPDLCSLSLVTTDDDREWAAREAVQMAERFWHDRAAMQATLHSAEEAVRIANQASGTVVLVDAADATSSGASGDSNAVLEALLDYGYKGRALMPIVDAPAVADAIKVGVGSTVRTTLGGTLDPGRFTPMPIEAKVRMLSDGRTWSESHGFEWFAGPTAVLEFGPHTVIVTSRPISLYDRSLFQAHGQDPTRFDAVVMKSPHARYEFFEAWAECLIGVDVQGSTSANLPSLGHTRCVRPMYPLELDTAFAPTPEVFARR